MKKITQLFTIMFLIASIETYAIVTFELTNKSDYPIWILGDADEDIFTGTKDATQENMISPNESFSANISNGEVELTISLVEPGQRRGQNIYRKYRTMPSANNKNKVLIWNHNGHPKAPLYPASKGTLMGLVKTKITNNIGVKELKLTGYYNL